MISVYCAQSSIIFKFKKFKTSMLFKDVPISTKGKVISIFNELIINYGKKYGHLQNLITDYFISLVSVCFFLIGVEIMFIYNLIYKVIVMTGSSQEGY